MSSGCHSIGPKGRGARDLLTISTPVGLVLIGQRECCLFIASFLGYLSPQDQAKGIKSDIWA
jgi:hypothetical protein